MSLLSKALSVGKKIATGVYNTVNSIGSSLSRLGQPAAAIKATPTSRAPIGTSSQAPNATSRATGAPVFAAPGGQLFQSAQSTKSLLGTQAFLKSPSTTGVSGSWGTSSKAPTKSAASIMDFGPASAPRTVTASTLSLSGLSGTSSFRSSGSGSIVLPTRNFVDGAGSLAGAMAGAKPVTYGDGSPVQYDEEGKPVKEKATEDTGEDFFSKYLADRQRRQDQYLTEQQRLDDERPSEAQLYREAERESGYRNAQQQVANYQQQLNAITAQAEADQLAVTGQGRGIPEPIILGQQAQISKEAAIKALPIAAQLAGAQGNLELARDHMDTLFKLRSEDARNDYEHRSKLLKSVYDFADEEQKLILQRMDKENELNNKLVMDNNDFGQTLASTALERGQGTIASKIMKLDPRSPDYQQELAGLAGRIAPDQKAVGGVGGGAPMGAVGGLSSTSQAVVSNPSLYYGFTPTQKAQVISELQANGYDISKLQNSKLSPGQQDDIANMNTVSALVDQVLGYNSDGTLEGLGALGIGTLKGLGAQLGFGSKEGQDVRSTIGNIQGTIAKLRGGTSFTANEQKLLDSYTPSINDNPGVALNKLNLLKDFIAQKNSDLLDAAQLNVTTGQISKPGSPEGDPLGIL